MSNYSDTVLKPCPFCGGEASVAEINAGGNLSYIAACCECDSTSNIYADEKECISSWNKRVYDQ